MNSLLTPWQTPTSFSGSSRRGTGPQPPSRHGSIAESETGASDRDHSDDGGNGQGGSGAANKRKRPSRYKGVSEEILNVSLSVIQPTSIPADEPMSLTTRSTSQKRRAQNRSSQRAYRDRKNMRIKELEAQLANVHRENDMLNLQLRAERQAGSAASGLQAGGADPTTCGLDWCALNLGLESADLSELAFSPDQMLGPWPLGISLPSFL